jgi:signal transduction histidine kinase
MRLVGDRPVVGRTVAEALPEAAAQGYVNLLDSVFQSRTASTSFGAKYVREAEPGGAVQERYVDFVYQPIQDDDGHVTGIFVDGHHVTAQKEAEIALSNNSALREQFIAVLGHDLRNPLAAISGGMNLLLKRSLDEKAKAIVDLVQASAKRMAADRQCRRLRTWPPWRLSYVGTKRSGPTGAFTPARCRGAGNERAGSRD